MKPVMRIAGSIAAFLLIAALAGCATGQVTPASETRQADQASQADQHKAHHPDTGAAPTQEATGDKAAK